MNQIAYVEVGEISPQNYIILKGQLPTEEEKVDCYWYEEDITAEEFAGEVNDLLKFYDVLVVGTPLPEQLRKEVEKYGNEA